MGAHICVSSARCLFLLLLLSFNLIVIASARAFLIQITGAGSTLSPYYVASNLSIGTPPQPQKLLISTEAESYSWVTCGPGDAFLPGKSSTFRYLSCGGEPCDEDLNPYPAAVGRLAQDTFSLHTTNGSSQGPFTSVPKVTFACADARSVSSVGFPGVASLTAGKQGLPAQLGVTKFAYCLPASNYMNALPTPLFLGEGLSYIFTNFPVQMNLSAFLGGKASLGIDKGTGLMWVGLKNVSIDLQETVSLRSPLKLQMSTTVAFSRLESRVYMRMRKVFRAKAAVRGIQRVAGQSGFDTCFNASTVGFSRVGPAVPEMEWGLVQAGGQSTALSVFGFNSVVSVSDSVLCWAFLEAEMGQPSVWGSFQQQGGLFEFDLRNRLLSFTGVLDFYQTTCTNFAF